MLLRMMMQPTKAKTLLPRKTKTLLPRKAKILSRKILSRKIKTIPRKESDYSSIRRQVQKILQRIRRNKRVPSMGEILSKVLKSLFTQQKSQS
jgi:hypothetical protein